MRWLFGIDRGRFDVVFGVNAGVGCLLLGASNTVTTAGGGGAAAAGTLTLGTCLNDRDPVRRSCEQR